MEEDVKCLPIYNGKVINDGTIYDKLEKEFPSKAQVVPYVLSCRQQKNNNENLNSYVYIHNDGRIEIEANVVSPRYSQVFDMETDYSK